VPAAFGAGRVSVLAAARHDHAMSLWDSDGDEEGEGRDGGDGRAPICPWCGVTALAKHLSNVLDSPFVCDNEDCEAFGDEV